MPSDQHNVAGNTYDKYASTNPIEKRMMSGFFGSLRMLLADEAPRVVVEIGAGEGRVTQILADQFPEATVFGLDIEREALAPDWDKLDTSMIAGDAEGLPFPDRSVDLIVGLEMLEHVVNPRLALQEISRVCRGATVLSVPREPIWRIGNIARGRYIRNLGNTPGHINHWSARAFEQLVGEYLDVTATERPMPWTMVRATPR